MAPLPDFLPPYHRLCAKKLRDNAIVLLDVLQFGLSGPVLSEWFCPKARKFCVGVFRLLYWIQEQLLAAWQIEQLGHTQNRCRSLECMMKDIPQLSEEKMPRLSLYDEYPILRVSPAMTRLYKATEHRSTFVTIVREELAFVFRLFKGKHGNRFKRSDMTNRASDFLKVWETQKEGEQPPPTSCTSQTQPRYEGKLCHLIDQKWDDRVKCHNECMAAQHDCLKLWELRPSNFHPNLLMYLVNASFNLGGLLQRILLAQCHGPRSLCARRLLDGGSYVIGLLLTALINYSPNGDIDENYILSFYKAAGMQISKYTSLLYTQLQHVDLNRRFLNLRTPALREVNKLLDDIFKGDQSISKSDGALSISQPLQPGSDPIRKAHTASFRRVLVIYDGMMEEIVKLLDKLSLNFHHNVVGLY